MALALDGTPVSGIFSTTGSKVLNLTTTVADTIIIVIVANEKNAAGFTTTGISDDHSLTWTQRKQLQWTVTSGAATKQDMEVYWAHATAAATYAITATLNQNTDDSCMVCFAVSGANTSSPFDVNGSLPASAADVTGSNVARQVTGISTTATNTFMFSAMANSINQTATSPTGFTNVASPNNGGGSLFEYLAVDYKIQSAAQSGITVTEGGANGQNWGMIVDAIKEATAEVDIPSAGTIDNAMGFSEAATVSLEQDLTVSAALGFSEAAVVDNATVQVTASAALGFDEAAAPQGDRNLAASAALGFSEAAAPSLERDLAASTSLGFAQAASLRSATRRQPVVCIVS